MTSLCRLNIAQNTGGREDTYIAPIISGRLNYIADALKTLCFIGAMEWHELVWEGVLRSLGDGISCHPGIEVLTTHYAGDGQAVQHKSLLIVILSLSAPSPQDKINSYYKADQ